MSRIRARRVAFTLVELLVVIAIIGVLVGLLLPAVQSAREAARRAQCSNNMKQLGIALHSYHDAHSALPRGNFETDGTGNGFSYRSWQGFSAQTMLLPFLDQVGIYDQLNFDNNAYNAVNAALGRNKIAGFLCPSDSPRFSNAPGNSYVVSSGPSMFYLGGNAGASATNPVVQTNHQVGMFNYRVTVRFNDVTDGLSKTIAASEIMHGDGENGTYSLGDTVRGVGRPGGFPNSFPTTAQVEAWGDSCSAGAASNSRGDSGANWIRGDLNQTVFNTLTNPNSPYPSCLSCSGCGASDNWGMVTATSRHPGGVTVLLGDGNVTFISDSIDNSTWQLLGATNDGNIVQTN
ncbi:hypothetical protein Pan216_52890 [Planctomycetes bacterium Pan216]|uniref:DUF1559 domain-containing protein n=1 Tax=Kolteria novifilia TaxID=2527975 RepID=A0A518BBR2_9BACT|nr:hypothetical protein Pan216_52890 [Planctomycetes bacterium Pan216]